MLCGRWGSAIRCATRRSLHPSHYVYRFTASHSQSLDFSDLDSKPFAERWTTRLDRTLAAHPGMSTLVFMASDAACVLGLSAALQLAQVPLSPSWLVAAALSEAIKYPIQLAVLGVVTPVLANVFPSLTRIRIGTVARSVFAKFRGQVVGTPASTSTQPAWAEELANRYGAAAFVGKNVLSLLTRLGLFSALMWGGATTLEEWMHAHDLVNSVAVKQVSYLTLSASLSVALLPLRLMAPAVIVPPLARVLARLRK